MTKLFLYFIFFLSAFSTYAQLPNTINFVHIGLEQGLSQSTILDIEQDDRGNMWFATYDGLNKYDGYTFTVYQHNENYAASISGDIVRTLKIDSKKRLWAGTEEGLSLYASGRDHFVNFYPVKGEQVPIIDIEEINSEELLVCTEKGIFLFNTESHSFSVDKLPTSHASVGQAFTQRPQ